MVSTPTQATEHTQTCIYYYNVTKKDTCFLIKILAEEALTIDNISGANQATCENLKTTDQGHCMSIQ